MRRSVLWAAVVLAGCGITELPPVQRIQVDSGEGQSAVAGEVLAEPVVARTLREDGSAAAWLLYVEIPDGGTIELDGAGASGVGASIASPDRDMTSVRWTLGDTPGEQRLRFYAVPSRGDTIETIVTAQALAPTR